MVDRTQEEVKRNACKGKNTRKISATSCRRGLGRASGLELDLVPPPIPLPLSCASPPLSRTPESGTVCLANRGAELFVDSSRRSECCCSLCRCSVWFLNIWRHCNRISISSCVCHGLAVTCASPTQHASSATMRQSKVSICCCLLTCLGHSRRSCSNRVDDRKSLH